jgi:8-oxoguanine deaminase
MSTLLVKNAEVLVTMDEGKRELKEADLYAEQGIIRPVGPTKELPAHADVVLDLSGQIVLPGFVNTHHHLDQTLTRNLPAAQNNNLFPWLQQAIRYQRKSRCNQPSSWHRVTGQADRIRPEFGHRLRRSLDW